MTHNVSCHRNEDRRYRYNNDLRIVFTFFGSPLIDSIFLLRTMTSYRYSESLLSLTREFRRYRKRKRVEPCRTSKEGRGIQPMTCPRPFCRRPSRSQVRMLRRWLVSSTRSFLVVPTWFPGEVQCMVRFVIFVTSLVMSTVGMGVPRVNEKIKKESHLSLNHVLHQYSRYLSLFLLHSP